MGKKEVKRQIRFKRVYLSLTFLAVLGCTYRIGILKFGGSEDKLQDLGEVEAERRRLKQPVSDGTLNYEVHQYPKDLFSDEALFAGAHLLHFLGMIYMFLGLAIVCDEYFVPSLEVIVYKLDVSHDVAGATFMAAGGSAPELFTSFIGTFISNSQVGFGTIIGSAVFNVLFVIGMCSVFSKGELKLTWWPFARDVFYYCLSLLLLTIFFGASSPNRIEAWEAGVLLLTYAGYIVLMIYNEKLQSWIYSNILGKLVDTQVFRVSMPLQGFRVGLLKLLGNIDGKSSYTDLVGTYMVKKIAGSVLKSFRMMDENENGVLDKDEVKKALRKLGVHRDALDKDVKTIMKAADTNGDGVISLEEFKNWYISQKLRASSRIAKLFHVFDQDKDGFISKEEFKDLLTAINGCEPPKEMVESILERSNSTLLINIASVIAWFDNENPSEMMSSVKPKGHSLLKASVVPASFQVELGPEQLQEKADVLNVEPPIQNETVSISFPFGEGWNSKLRQALTIPILFPLWCTLFDVREKKYKKYFGLTFIGSMIWLGVFSFLMVQWATVIAWCWNIPSQVMGITFIAAGTSIPDLLTSVIVARQGHGDMAVSSSIGSNIFDILIGLPLPWLCWCISTSGDMYVGNGDSLLQSVLVLFGMLALVFVAIVLNGWVLTKRLGYTMFVLYVVFVIQDLLTAYQVWGQCDWCDEEQLRKCTNHKNS